MNGTRSESLRALRRVTHNQDWLTQAGRLLLYATRVGQHHAALIHQIDKLQILQRFDKEHIPQVAQIITKHLMNRFTHIRIEVHRIDKIHLGIFVLQVADGRHHVDEPFSEVLPSMPSNQDQLATIIQTSYIIARISQHLHLFGSQRAVALQLLNHPMQRINHRIACDKNLAMHLLLQQILLRKRRRREIIGRDATRYLSVHLLRPRAIDVMCTQARLHMPHRDLLIEGGQRSRCRGRCVAMHHYNVRLTHLEHIPHTRQHTRRDVRQVLSLLHDIEVKIRFHIKDVQHLVQHFAVLSCNTHDRLKITRTLLELLHQRAHLNSLWPCPED